jgi:hypothetical protein
MMQGNLHHIYSSISTLFSSLNDLWVQALDEVTNTFLPNVHSTCKDGKSSCCCYREYITCSSSPHASKFIVGLENPSYHSSSKINLTYGMWLTSPNKMLIDGLSSHRKNIPSSVNNSVRYGLSYFSSDKQGTSWLMKTSWSCSSSCLG